MIRFTKVSKQYARGGPALEDLTFHLRRGEFAFKSDLDVVGAMHAEIYLSVDAPDTDLWAKVYDVAPDGKRFAVTYWCEKCAIRTYTPGTCWCCRRSSACRTRSRTSATPTAKKGRG